MELSDGYKDSSIVCRCCGRPATRSVSEPNRVCCNVCQKKASTPEECLENFVPRGLEHLCQAGESA